MATPKVKKRKKPRLTIDRFKAMFRKELNLLYREPNTMKAREWAVGLRDCLDTLHHHITDQDHEEDEYYDDFF